MNKRDTFPPPPNPASLLGHWPERARGERGGGGSAAREKEAPRASSNGRAERGEVRVRDEGELARAGGGVLRMRPGLLCLSGPLGCVAAPPVGV